MKKFQNTLSLSFLLAVTFSFLVSCQETPKTSNTTNNDPDTGTLKIEKENNFGYTVEGNVITLSADGTEDNPPKYTLSGNYDGKIIVQSKGTVLTLNGVTITNTDAPAIEALKKVEIKVAANTENTIKTTGDYNKENKIGAITGEKKVELGGSGTLTVSGTVCHGIKANDMEVKGSGTYTISGSADGSAINCNEFTVKEDKTFTLNLKDSKNGVKADGNINIASGTYNLSNLSTGFKTDTVKDDGTEHSITVGTGATVNFESNVKKHYSSDTIPD